MNKKKLITILVICLGLLINPALGQDKDYLMRALDTNGDGELSADEIKNIEAVLKALDTNGDGKISREEFKKKKRGKQRRNNRPEEKRIVTDLPESNNTPAPEIDFITIKSDVYLMGDHHDLGGKEHRNDEVPVHQAHIDSFQISRYETTNIQYCEYLNFALDKGRIQVQSGYVYLKGRKEILCDTYDSDPASSILYRNNIFSVIQNRDNHPVVCIRWPGAAAFCNWMSEKKKLPSCYDLKSWKCNYSKKGIRLPTEAEWEYASRGGAKDPYFIYPWGDDADYSKVNWPGSKDPFETGPYPWTTPVGFFNGALHHQEDFNWPGSQRTYQTHDGVNGFGLYDAAGNVWEWVNDWYARDYSNSSKVNPTGPTNGTPMRDNKPYRVLRGGNWYNGDEGHSRVSNRNPSYYRGPDDPDHRWYHIGFRVACAATGKTTHSQDNIKPRSKRKDRESGQSLNRQIGLIKNSSQAWSGYTLFAPKHYLVTYLIDNKGQKINSWTSQYEPGQSVYLLENGHLLHCCFTKGPGGIGGGEGGRLEEYDWEGNLVWEYWCSDEKKMMHHDVEILPNGNILAMIVEKKSYDECIAAGFSPNSLRDGYLLPEYIVELEKKGKNDANIVWEWHVWDHLIQDNDPNKPNYGEPSEHPRRIWVEVNGRRATSFWNHMNSIDYNEELDQIMLSVRGCSELWILDHSITTEQAKGKGGDLLYRWGNPAAYDRGTKNDQQLFQQHDAQWIKKGCPGAGNILIFNNGLKRANGGRLSYSSVDEIIPPKNYTLKKGKAYGPEKPKWSYTAPNKTDFYAEAISGCQRLPNGHTLICDGTSGVFFEVNPKGEKTWEYVCPVDGEAPMAQGDAIPLDHRGHAMNAVFKIERYPLNYPAFKGKDMAPKGKVTGSKPEAAPENLSRNQRSRGGGKRQKDKQKTISRNFSVSSPVLEKGSALPIEFTGDGQGYSMPVEWSGAPENTKCFALSLWHKARDREKSYWVVYDIPADVTSLPKNAQGIGIMGYNDRDRQEYMPMRSKGGGAKEYNITVYALSEKPAFHTDNVTREVLIEAVKQITLAETTLTYTYERSSSEENKKYREGGRRKEGRSSGRDNQRNRSKSSTGAFMTNTPEHDVDIILGRPTKTSITMSVLTYWDMEGHIEYGEHKKTKTFSFQKDEPVDIVLDSLKPDKKYDYCLFYKKENESTYKKTDQHFFHTQRTLGQEFKFTIIADSHLDDNTLPTRYENTLKNALLDQPDFVIDLGDTFMVDKYRGDYQAAKLQYLAQRYYFGLLCHSAPLFFTIGNHDGEAGWRLDGSIDNEAVWSNLTRKKYLPNPYPDGFYSGNTHQDKNVGLLEDYYAWEWGGALFVVLDPYWHTTSKPRQDNNCWNRTLGQEQYLWLSQTLKQSQARLKFIFIHHLVGGADRNGRGGVEAASFFEWGGENLDGTYAFDKERPNWEAPIHDLLVKNKASIVFHGHDHFFAKQDLDGIVYQLVPQPGARSKGRKNQTGEYGYVNGDILGGSGHLRVTVSGNSAQVEYVLSALTEDKTSNGEVAFSYSVTQR